MLLISYIFNFKEQAMKIIYRKRIAGSLIVIVLLCYILSALSPIVREKNQWCRKPTFLENCDDINVLFLGTSHAVNAIFPMELWGEYGIASYNMAGHGNTIPNSYWVMMNALDYAEPKLIVLDCSGISSPQKTSDSYLHWSMDCFKLSKNKIHAINDLFPDMSKRIEYLWDFSLYHSRWNDITREDFEEQQYIHYGGEPRIDVVIPNKIKNITTITKEPFETYGTEYLRKIIDECQSRGIAILLTYLPFPAVEFQLNESLVVRDIANEYGINYINFLETNIVDYSTDCYDTDSHLNPSGAEKITNYIGSYIKSKYQIEDKRRNEQFQDWNENYELYKSYKIDTIKEQTNLATYLMLLRNKDISLCLYIKGNSDILNDEQIYNLIDNTSIYQELILLNQARKNSQDYFVIIDNDNEDVREYIGSETITNLNSTFGNINYSAEIQIVLIDKWTDEVIDTVIWAKDSSTALTKFSIDY